MPYLLDGRQLRVGRPFTHPDGRQFGGDWNRLTDDEKASLGITWQAPPESFDRAYYTALNQPRDLATVKATLVEQTKDLAKRDLAITDWYVNRKSELGTAIPDSVVTYRAAVRTVCTARESEINGASDIPTLKALVEAPAKIWDESKKAEVDNTAAHLTPWPVLAE